MSLQNNVILRDQKHFEAYFSQYGPQRCAVEQVISQEYKEQKKWQMIGFCQACERASRFKMAWKYSNGTTPNFREWLICEHCGLNNRQRFMAAFIKKYLAKKKRADIYIYEQVTYFYEYMKRFFTDFEIIGSEYLGMDKTSGETINGIRHEDAMSLSFEDASLDVIASNDVFEHVPCVENAFAEAARVLSPKGMMAFTIPFYSMNQKTSSRACIKDGQIQHMQPEQYHGNPVDAKGCLVFYDFGWDILDICKNAGFKDVYALGYYSPFYGYMGEGIQLLFVAEK